LLARRYKSKHILSISIKWNARARRNLNMRDFPYIDEKF